MKRNADLVRSILLDIESAPALQALSGFTYDGISEAEIIEHVEIMIDAGLIEGKVLRHSSGGRVIVNRLTWQGHDFLQVARDDTLWKKAKKSILKPGVGWTFELLKEWLKFEAKKALGMPAGGGE